MSAETLDPAIEAAVRRSFASQGLMDTLGARLIIVEPGRVVIEVPLADRITQQDGLFHGGAVGAIGDTAGGYAALTRMPAGAEVLTIEYKVNFIRPAAGELLRAEATLARAGRSVTVARVEAQSGSGEKLEPCALLQATYMRIEGRKGS